jgi:hypothetical protein
LVKGAVEIPGTKKDQNKGSTSADKPEETVKGAEEEQEDDLDNAVLLNKGDICVLKIISTNVLSILSR